MIDSLEAVGQHVEADAIPFAVLYDEAGSVTVSYRVDGYPTAFRIDRSGKVVWEGSPTNMSMESAALLIQDALSDAGTAGVGP